jgi:sulfate permease, SulP family
MFNPIQWPLTKDLKGDIFGGLTTAVVALPLALAFGVASGLGPMAGIYGAIATGFFASLFGGTPSQITGPTGPMTVVMAVIVTTYAESLPQAFAIVMLGGIFQIAFGTLKLGRYIAYTPYSVVSGFMTGIGVIIIFIQMLPFLGLPTAGGGAAGAISTLFSMSWGGVNIYALGLAALTLAVSIYWPGKLRKFIPPPLAALLICTSVSLVLPSAVPVIGHIPSGLPSLVVPTIDFGIIGPIIEASFILALLGSIDSLLTSLVADSITRTQHNPNRELIGQGIGNIAASLMGALPGAGATMRTVVNVQAGGRSPLSGIIHSLLLLALVLGIGPLAEIIPHAVLAGILMKVGWDIIDWGYVKRMRRVPVEKMLVMVVTLGLTVFVDLVTAVAVGIIMANFVNASRLETEQLKGVRHTDELDHADHLTDEERAQITQSDGKIRVTLLTGAFSYASARELSRYASAGTSNEGVSVFDFTDVGYMDPSAAMAVDSLFENVQDHGREVMISGLQGSVADILGGLGVLDRIAVENRFDDRADAIDAALKLTNPNT